MRKIFLLALSVMFFLTANSQEINKSNTIKTYYKSLDQVIQTSENGENVVFLFQDQRYNQLDVIESVNFKDEKAMIYFFNKLAEVQNSPKTDKTEDLSVLMNEHVLNKAEVKIVRLGRKQFVTYVYVGEAYTIIPKTYLKKLLKKIKA